MNGNVDAALLPLWPGDALEVVQGGNSATQSSGAMGGSVLIESPFKQTRQGFSGVLGFEGGSYDAKASNGSVDFVSGKISSRIRGAWQAAENDFPFKKTGLDGQPFTTRQPNNFSEKTDIQQFNQLIISKKHLLKTAAWFQNAFRQIPPASTEAPSNTWQRDRSGRAVATWEFTPDRHSRLQTRLAWQDEYIAFHFAGDTEESRAQTGLLGVEWQQKAAKQTAWRIGGTAQSIHARSDGYKQKQVWFGQTRLALFSDIQRSFWKGIKVSAMARQEWASAQATPFTWTLGVEIPAWKLGYLRGHASRNFNLPTFNDRYWKTLDSTALDPEKGYSSDLGWVYRNKHFTGELTGFQLILDDWILWQPGADGIFRPGNLRKVRSQGLEGTGSLTGKYFGLDWKLKGRFQWSETKNVAVYGGAETVLGKQLPYTPQVSAGGSLRVEKNGVAGAYLHQYTGRRFVTTDNKNVLPGFQTGTLLLQYDLAYCHFWRWSQSLAIDFRLENIWDVTYESLANRPMPGRNWRFGIQAAW